MNRLPGEIRETRVRMENIEIEKTQSPQKGLTKQMTKCQHHLQLIKRKENPNKHIGEEKKIMINHNKRMNQNINKQQAQKWRRKKNKMRSLMNQIKCHPIQRIMIW